jgi:hypothetical protein
LLPTGQRLGIRLGITSNPVVSVTQRRTELLVITLMMLLLLITAGELLERKGRSSSSSSSAGRLQLRMACAGPPKKAEFESLHSVGLCLHGSHRQGTMNLLRTLRALHGLLVLTVAAQRFVSPPRGLPASGNTAAGGAVCSGDNHCPAAQFSERRPGILLLLLPLLLLLLLLLLMLLVMKLVPPAR